MKRSLKNKIKYEDSPIEDVQIVADFLPGPDQLAFREETVKLTTAPSKKEPTFGDKVQDES